MYAYENYALPAMVAQQAGVSRLGAITGVYRPLLSSSLAIIGMVVGVIVVDILLLVALILFLGRLPFILLYAPILVIIYGIYAFTIRDLRVYEFSSGLIRAKGDRINPIRWDQVTSVTQQQRRRSTYYFAGGVTAVANVSRSTLCPSHYPRLWELAIDIYKLLTL